MKPNQVRTASPWTHASAFTLTEIVIALAVIATAFVGILGLLPAGLDASRQAVNSTVVGVILEDVHNRLQNRPLKTGAVDFSPAFFDDHGVFIRPDADPAEQARRLYRVDVQVGNWKDRPANTGSLLPLNVSLSWPVDTKTGVALGKDNPKTVVTYAVTTLTGSDWALIDPSYVPKIGF
jgi:uncharacterized protein (TIGR02598 family)